jgi:DNA modification methylase
VTTRILVGDCLEALRDLEDGSVQCVVTSPPYWGLRDYGVAGQLGLEASPFEYVDNLVDVFREVWRVLRDDGTVWLNLGDSYCAAPRGSASPETSTLEHPTRATAIGGAPIDKRGYRGERLANTNTGDTARPKYDAAGPMARISSGRLDGIKPKDLVGIPWRVALALQADRWYLRSDIVWNKPNPMPESVRDRPTKAHEYLFLLAKSERYYYNAEAIKEPAGDVPAGNAARRVAKAGDRSRLETHLGSSVPWSPDGSHRPQYRRALEIAREKGLTDEHLQAIRACGISDTARSVERGSNTSTNDDRLRKLAGEAKEVLGGYYREFLLSPTRNKRSVWTVGTQPFKGAHFATFPPALIEPCILAGAPKGGVVLDPFGGAGTTALVADRLGRDAILIEINEAYAEIAHRRLIDDSPAFASVSIERSPGGEPVSREVAV